MNLFRIALANIRFPASPDESIALAEQAIDRAALEKARIVCFPECFVPGYRGIGKSYQPHGQERLLVADIDLSTATGLLAARGRIEP